MEIYFETYLIFFYSFESTLLLYLPMLTFQPSKLDRFQINFMLLYVTCKTFE